MTIDKDPSTYGLLTYAWVVLLSLWGGVVHYIRKVREGTADRFNVTELIGDLVTSGFAGVVTFYLCEWANLAPVLTAALVGICGHMGSRALFMAEWALKERLGVRSQQRGDADDA